MPPRDPTENERPARPGSDRHTFTWPPKPAPVEETAITVAPEPPDVPIAPAPAGVLHTVEAAWFGVVGRAWGSLAAMPAQGPSDLYCPRCATTVGPFEADGSGCSACRDKRLVWTRCVRLGSYEGPLRDAILLAKYTAWRRTCQDLGSELGRAVAVALEEARVHPRDVVVCPVATSTRRRLARGVDHTMILAREVARRTDAKLLRGLRRRHGPPQQGLSKDVRRRNVAGAFKPRIGICSQLDGRVVILVDDVRTTGATLTAAGRSLREGIRACGGQERELWAAVVAVVARL